MVDESESESVCALCRGRAHQSPKPGFDSVTGWIRYMVYEVNRPYPTQWGRSDECANMGIA